MALVKYNPDNVSGGSSYRTPTVRFSRKGASALSASAAELLGLKDGDRISFMKDEDDADADWSMIKDNEGFELRGQKEAKSLLFNSAGMASMVLDSVKNTGTSATFRISTESFEIEGEENQAWTIIMASGK